MCKSRNNAHKCENSKLSSLEESVEKLKHKMMDKTIVLNICNSLCTTTGLEYIRHKVKVKHITFQPTCKHSSKLTQVILPDE